MITWEEIGAVHRDRLGIDGTAGDAQDVEHPYINAGFAFCVVCGLAKSYRKHTPDEGPETP